MERFIPDNIPFQPDIDSVAVQVRVGRTEPHFGELEAFVAEAMAIARPKAMYRIGYVESRGSNSVVINGIPFASRVLRVNLEQSHRVFAYLATCGLELQEWTGSLDDPLARYWGNAFQQLALRAASRALSADINNTCFIAKITDLQSGQISINLH